MTKRSNLITIGVIVIAMIGIPVFSAIQMALQGSGSIESQMDKGIAHSKTRLPLEMDDHITLTDIERDGRDFIYAYEVKVSQEKLSEMKAYFRRKAQFDYCHSPQFRTFKAQNIRTVERFKAETSEQMSFEIITTANPCTAVKGTAVASILTVDIAEESFLNAQYLSFFLPAKLTDTLSIVSLMPPPHFTLEHKASRENLIDLGDVLGPEILAKFCYEEGVETLNVYVKPSDHEEPIFIYKLSDEICQSGSPEYVYVSKIDLQSLEQLRELSAGGQ